MIKYEEIKEILKSKSLEKYKELKKVEKETFDLVYIDKEKSFSLFFDQIEEEIKSWINSLNQKLELENLQNEPNYALIHRLMKELYPSDYADEVGVVILDDEKLKRFNLNKEEMIEKSGEFNFDNWYGEALSEFFGYELDEKKSNIIDRTEMIEDFKNKPLEELNNLATEWEELFVEEYGLGNKAFLVALGQATYEIICKSIK
jgi:hypothetical protein